jgi:bacteriocin biosynthesis cyclodehydratase domain-containing protein
MSRQAGQAPTMRPALKSGLLPVWRDRDTIQIGIDARRAVALSGMRQAAVFIGLLDGSRDRTRLIADAAALGIPETVSEQILTLLAAGGALDDFPAGTWRAVPGPLRTRLAAELATASLAHGDGDGGARFLARRRAAIVRIEGERRVGRVIARVLAASGVGRLRFRGPSAGSPAAAGQAPVDGGPARPDLVILVGYVGLDRADALVRAGTPHLAVTAAEAIGVVGPLVVPGFSACLRCLEYARAARDPAWPLILAQLAARRAEPPACDAVLTTAVAAQAAAQALTALDRFPAAGAAVNGTLEIVLPDWRWRRRSWQPHPSCVCTGLRTRPDT